MTFLAKLVHDVNLLELVEDRVVVARLAEDGHGQSVSLDAVFEKRRSQPRQFEFFAIALCVMFNRLHASHSTTLAFWRSGVEYTFFRADVHLVVHDTKNYGTAVSVACVRSP